MDELKAIITLISQLGMEAKWAFFAYLGYALLTYVIGFGVLTFACVLIYKLMDFGIKTSALSRRILTTLDRYDLSESETTQFILYLANNKKFIKENILDL